MTCKDCGWKSVNPSGAIFCGYTDLRTWEDESCGAWKPARVGITSYTEEDWKRTNADRIRAMTDEELAMWINDVTTNALSVLALGSNKQTKTIFYWLDWLKQEAE